MSKWPHFNSAYVLRVFTIFSVTVCGIFCNGPLMWPRQGAERIVDEMIIIFVAAKRQRLPTCGFVSMYLYVWPLLEAKAREISLKVIHHVSAKRVSSTRVIGEELDVFGSLRCSETLWPLPIFGTFSCRHSQVSSRSQLFTDVWN